jgi:nicotinamide mononucleotide (NMN) deamidase PncC
MNLTLSTAEPYTGGLIAQRLSGTGSAQFLQGIVLNTQEATRGFLGIGMGEYRKLKRDKGRLVLCLAEKTRERCRSDLGLSASGFSEKGTSKDGGEIKLHLYIGIASEGKREWADYQLGGTKRMLQERMTIIALDTLRKELLNMGKA